MKYGCWNPKLSEPSQHTSPRKRIRMVSDVSLLSDLHPTPLSSLSVSAIRKRATSLQDTIECAAGLLGLAEKDVRLPEVQETPSPTPVVEREPPPAQPQQDTSHILPLTKASIYRRQQSAWWTPELLSSAIEFGMAAPITSRTSWRSRLGEEQRMRLAASVGSTLMLMGGL